MDVLIKYNDGENKNIYTNQDLITVQSFNQCVAESQSWYIYMRKHSQHNKDERIHFFSKIYLSHFIRNGCERLCVRGELETEQNATYWPPVPLSLSALLSRSAGLLNRGSWGPIALCWALVLSYLISNLLTPTNWTLLHRVISLFDVHLLSVSVASVPNSTRP